MSKEEKKEYGLWIIGGVTTLLIIGAWIYTYYALKDMAPDKRGTLGDMFGTINALFSGLALAGIIFTILLQRKELGYQRDELRATREEFIIQNETLKRQRFENTFFNLLSIHNQIVDGIDIEKHEEKKTARITGVLDKEYDRVTITKRDYFKYTYDIFKSKLKANDNDEEVERLYMKHYDSRQSDLGHYFRNLYRIVKFVHETEFVTKEELNVPLDSKKYVDNAKYYIYNHQYRYKYTSMIRAQLSDFELLWLFYNCLYKNGNEKFKPLIEEYALLKNMPIDKLHNETYADKYKEGAFKSKY